MARFWIYARRHWQAGLVLVLCLWRLSRGDDRADGSMWLAVGLAAIGLALNLVVILANGGMPARIAVDEISDADRPHYHPIGPTTRLAWLSDWIPVGSLLISPGDVALLVAVGLLFAGAMSVF